MICLSRRSATISLKLSVMSARRGPHCYSRLLQPATDQFQNLLRFFGRNPMTSIKGLDAAGGKNIFDNREVLISDVTRLRTAHEQRRFPELSFKLQGQSDLLNVCRDSRKVQLPLESPFRFALQILQQELPCREIINMFCQHFIRLLT